MIYVDGPNSIFNDELNDSDLSRQDNQRKGFEKNIDKLLKLTLYESKMNEITSG